MSAVFENRLSVSAQNIKPGTPDAKVMVRASLHAGVNFETCISCGFDLSPEGALKLADELTKLANELLAAQVKK